MTHKTEQAMFGAGCFWGVQAVFDSTPGVVNTLVGYAGGHTDKPTYEDVCSDETGHAEVVHVEYDPAVASYEKLLEVFWQEHDPTQVNRQGPDVGTQYRSVIFAYTPTQVKTAETSRTKIEKTLGRKVATQIENAPAFHAAEDYHQHYLKKRGKFRCHV